MSTSPEAPGSLSDREFYEYPGHYNDPDEDSAGVGDDVQRKTRSGSARAKQRLEEQRSDALTFSGTSNSLRMRVGQRFEIFDHADKGFNGTYLLVRIRVGGGPGEPARLERGERAPGASAGIVIEFDAVPAETPIRPPMRPKPRAHLRTARVVGPKEDEPYVDDFGRIKIQFAWDREGQLDEHSSCWVRMATPVAHHGQGSYIAHRVGAEVLVDFLDGDVDRPIVVSALFNGDNRQPQKLPDDATRAVLYRGLSVPGNKGKNEISCEDRAGREEIFLHAQKDLNERVLHNHSETVGANQSYSIGANQSFSVGANQSISVGANRTVDVKGDENIHIKNSRHENVDDGESVTVKGGRSHTVATKDDALSVASGNRSVKVAQLHSLSAKSATEVIETTLDISAGTSITLHHGGDSTLFIKASEASLRAASKVVLSTGESTFTLEGGKVTISAASEIALSCGSASLTMKSSGVITGSGGTEVSFGVKSSLMKLDGSKATVSGAAVDVSAVGQTVIGGAIIKIG